MKLFLLLMLACLNAEAMVLQSDRDLTYCIASTLFNSIRVYSLKAEAGSQGTVNDLKDSLEADGHALVFAMNAGMYQTDLTPMGLLVSDGKQLHPLNTHRGSTNFYAQPNGVFYMQRLRAGILSTADYQRAHIKPTLATQSGPMLMHRGRVMTSRTVSPTATSKYVRNAVCAFGPTKIAFVITNRPMTMSQFATLLRDNLHCVDALYLDGGISHMYSPYMRKLNDPSFVAGPVFAILHW